MSHLAIYAAIVGFIYYLIVQMSGPPIVPGSAGVSGFIFFSLIGQGVGAVLAYFAYIGVNPEIDFDLDEGKTFAMLPAAFVGGIYFTCFVYSVIGHGDILGAMRDALGNTDSIRVVGFIAIFPVAIGFLPLLIIVPLTAFLALIGLIKLAIYLSSRPKAIDAIVNDPDFDLDAIMADLRAKTASEPWLWSKILMPNLAKWEADTKIYWAKKLAEQYDTTAAAMDAIGAAYQRNRRKARDEKKDT